MHIATTHPTTILETISIGHLNLWNFFDSVDNPRTRDTVVPKEDYKLRLKKLELVITTTLNSPNIISFNEIENKRTLTDLLNQPALKALGYKGIIRPSNDLRGITTAVIYRGPLTVTKVESVNPEESFIGDPAYGQKNRSLLYARPPLVVDFKVSGTSQALDGISHLTVVVNHFKSKLGGDGPEPRRQRQGEFLGEYLDRRGGQNPKKETIVIGDLNATYSDGAYQKLARRKDGSVRFYDSLKTVPDSERYTYVYRGQKNLLDHLMTTGKLRLHSVSIPHIDTIKGAAKYKLDPTTVVGISDHDPILATFYLS